MIISDTAVKRPVLAGVLALLLVAFGLVAFDRLALREYPNIDPPVVSITTGYPGASASVIESRITKIIEDRVAGVEGIKFIQSVSMDGRSRITIEFDVNRDIYAAANDVRDRVARVSRQLPDGADIPEVQKVDGDEDVRNKDFTAVRGTYESNKFVKGLLKENSDVEERANKALKLLRL